jgi:hypothetical protein
MYLQKVISKKLFKKNLFFAGIMLATDEKSRIRILIKIRRSVVRIHRHPRIHNTAVNRRFVSKDSDLYHKVLNPEH